MKDLLEQLGLCVEKGKSDRNAAFPPELRGMDGASELTLKALEAGFSANQILNEALMPAMQRVGDRFAEHKAFIPDLMIAARAMNAAMEHLKPFFESGEAQHRGKIVLGTVEGDQHDIGKNIVKMVLKGEGWDVIDLGTNTSATEFAEAVAEHPGSLVGMSALLTTTMVKMEESLQAIRAKIPATKVFVGGAPLSQAFSDQIGADGYFPDPHSFALHLREIS